MKKTAMTEGRQHIVLLPAYNEAPNLPGLFAALEQTSKSVPGLRVILVDDGSTDGTGTVAKQVAGEIPLEVVTHAENQGLGAAMLTGIRQAMSIAKAGDVTFALDSDNSHNPLHFIPMLHKLNDGYDIVIASRYQPYGAEIGLPAWRSLGSRFVCTILNIFLPIENVRDYTCGFRAYSEKSLRLGLQVYGETLISENSFVCMAELLAKLDSVGARVDEVPLVLRYDLKQGKSKMPILKTVLRYAKFIATNRQIIQETKVRLSNSSKSCI